MPEVRKVVVDPITRIEGHLKIEVTVEDGVVKEARSSGMLFRGLEKILVGREPRDAQVITQRICGVCPQSHGLAAALTLDSAFGIAGKIPENGRIIRNLIQGAHVVQDHILHFYHLAALDYVDVTKVSDYNGSDSVLNSIKRFIERGQLTPFFPRYEGDYRLSPELNQQAVAHYVKALEIRRKGHEMVAIFSGKVPHSVGVIPGGVTERPTADKMAAFLWRLNEIRDFIDNVYIPDVVAVAEAYSDYFEIGTGCRNLLSYGAYDLEVETTDLTRRKRLFKQGTTSSEMNFEELDVGKIKEFVKYSWYEDSTTARTPSTGETIPQPGKQGGYSWLKAPRYNGKVYEVGPLARVMVTYAHGDPVVKKLVDMVLSHFKAPVQAMFSVLGRHAARALTAKIIADAMEEWLLQLKLDEPICVEYEVPEEGRGMGLTEAARGALGHWIEIKDKKIANYQCVVPTTWNASPKDDEERPGPIEQALIGTRIRDVDNPFEIGRIVRSFDPCIACAVHMIRPGGREMAKFPIV